MTVLFAAGGRTARRHESCEDVAKAADRDGSVDGLMLTLRGMKTMVERCIASEGI